MDQDGNGKVERDEFIRGLKWIQKAISLSKKVETTPNLSPGLSRSKSLTEFVSELSESQIQTMRELFKLCDVDQDGVITKDELYSVMHKQLDLHIGRSEFEIFWNDLDTNKDGKLDFNEWLKGLKWLQKGLKMKELTETETLSVQQKCDMLAGYIRQFLERSAEVAKKSSDSKDFNTALTLLDIMDFTTAETLEELTDISLTTREVKKKINDASTAIKQRPKK